MLDVDLLGMGRMAGITAEMALMDSSRLPHLVLVDATGFRPQQGEILDVFVLPRCQVIERGFLEPQGGPEYPRIYGATPI
jgi:hypothetical protein